MIRYVLVILSLSLYTAGNARDIFNTSNDTKLKKIPKTFTECLDRLDFILSDSLKEMIRKEEEKEFCAIFFRCSDFEDAGHCEDYDYGLKEMLNLVNTGYPDTVHPKTNGSMNIFSHNNRAVISDISAWFNAKGVHNSDVMLRILFYAYHRMLNNMDSAETDPDNIISKYTNIFRIGKNHLLLNSASEQGHGLRMLEEDVFNNFRFKQIRKGDTLQEIMLMHDAGNDKQDTAKSGFVSIYFKVADKMPGINRIMAEVVTIQYENSDGQVHFYDKGTYKFKSYKIGKVLEYRPDELLRNRDEMAYKAWLKSKDNAAIQHRRY